LARIIVAPASRRSRGSSVFTVACVPTGMKAGVSTGPCGVTKTPARAAPAVESIRKAKGDAMNYTITIASPYE